MYIGPKGYSIPKASIAVNVEVLIKKDLTIKPFSINNTKNRFLNKIETFPAYREEDGEIYVPMYYGISKFGIPTDVRINEGVNICVPFNGSLRDYQEPVIAKTLDYFRNTPNPISSGLLELPCAWGKTGGALYMVSQISKKTLVIEDSDEDE